MKILSLFNQKKEKNEKESDPGISMGMGFFMTEDGRTYVTVDLKFPKEKAITMANSHFKIKKERIGCDYGWIRNETLYFKEIRGARKVWLFWRKIKTES